MGGGPGPQTTFVPPRQTLRRSVARPVIRVSRSIFQVRTTVVRTRRITRAFPAAIFVTIVMRETFLDARFFSACRAPGPAFH